VVTVPAYCAGRGFQPWLRAEEVGGDAGGSAGAAVAVTVGTESVASPTRAAAAMATSRRVT
jgi:hypothetical protein